MACSDIDCADVLHEPVAHRPVTIQPFPIPSLAVQSFAFPPVLIPSLTISPVPIPPFANRPTPAALQPDCLNVRPSASLFTTPLHPEKSLQLSSNIERLVRSERHSQPSYLQRSLIEASTIYQTSFFRDQAPFEALRTSVLPRLIAGRRRDRRLRIWSAGCSTGQETYSLAILLLENFPELATWELTLLGTDHSSEAIDYAQGGQYRSIEVEQGLDTHLLDRYFTPDREHWTVKPELRDMCRFEVVDLTAPLLEPPLFDLVLLRNVLLFFLPEQRPSILQIVHRKLASYGFLMLGNSEHAEDSSSLFLPECANGSYFFRPTFRR